MAKRTKADTKAVEALLEQALKEAKLSAEATAQQRIAEVGDLEFEAGAHFTAAELESRRTTSRPSEVFDQISGPVLQVTNQPVPRIVVAPVGSEADPKTAEFWQGYLRSVENRSHAERAYKWARWHTARMGRGFWRIRHDRINWRTREMDVKIEAIDNQHSVYPDPRAWLSPTNGQFGHIMDYMPWDEFEQRFGATTDKVDLDSFKAAGDVAPEWATKEHVRVGERYWVTMAPTTLCRLTDGRTVEKTAGATYPPEQIEEEWEAERPRIKWMRYTQVDVLEQKDVPGEFIPIVQIDGQRRRMPNGRLDYRGLVRMAKGPSRALDFNENAILEGVNHGSYATWLIEEGQIEGYEKWWAAPHLTKPPYLPYKRADVAGHPLPAPQRVTIEPAIVGMVMAADRAQNHIRQITGVPDVFAEEHRREQSGRAIRERRDQQALTTNNYADGLSDGIALTGHILMSMGREVLNAPRVLRLTGADEKPMLVIAHAGEAQRPQAEQLRQSVEGRLDDRERTALKGFFDVMAGDFDITASAGRNSATGRMETVETLRELIPVMPPPMAVKAIPMLVKSLDAPGMQELAAEIGPNQDQQIPPLVQQRLMQLDQYAQAATEQLNAAKDQLADKQAELQMKREIAMAEIASKEKIVATQEETKRIIALAEIEQQVALQQFSAQQGQLERMQGDTHEIGMARLSFDQGEQQAEAGRAHARKMAESGHQMTLEQQQVAAEQAAATAAQNGGAE